MVQKKKKCLSLMTFALALLMVLFAIPAKAQDNVYMHTGSTTVVGSSKIKFYDSGGRHSGPSYYWERWFQRNESYTFTFMPEAGKKIKVTFKPFEAYTDNNGASSPHVFTSHTNWALRLNTAELSIYDGEELITTYTGNVIDEFSVVANGAMTFHFQSYGYREEGWEAEVEQVDAYTLVPPTISFEACSDNVVINANNTDAQVYYNLNNEPDPTDPLQGAELYEGPFPVEVGTTVYAIVKVGNEYSTAAALQFTDVDVTPIPGLPTVERDVNTITMTPAPIVQDINETYEVWYTTAAGENPTYIKYTGPFEWTIPHTTFRVITRAQTCSDKQSDPLPFPFEKVQVPDPVITYTVTDETTGLGTVQIDCPDGYVISYTSDGSTPIAAGGTTNSVTITDVTPGSTFNAIAYKSNGEGGEDPNYQQSNVVSVTCIPGGDGQGGVYGSLVLLDDREDHSWSYYSMGGEDNPVHSLKPADVKITYYGYGDNAMTSTDTEDQPTNFDANVASTAVAVGPNTPGNQFIYLKTLENANPDGSTGENQSYPYTLIPNPFSKRPTYSNSTITTRQVYLNWSCTNWTYNGNQATATYEYTGADNQPHVVQNTSNGNITINVKVGTTITLKAKASRNRDGYRPTITARLDNSSGTQIGTLTATNTTEISTTTSTITSSENIYRGFYAWRVKHLSGVTIQGYNVGDIIPAETEIEFVTNKAKGNEVEFEALWAQAYVVTSNNATGLHAGVSYERNFVVTTDAITANLNVPVTYSTYNPDGTGGSSTTVTLNTSTLNSDTKFENINLTGGNLVTANNHYLCFGRGIDTGRNAANIRGMGGGSSNELNYMIRLESGQYNEFAFIGNGNWTMGNRVLVKAILGCDYDRATNTNNLLRVASEGADASMFYSTGGLDFSHNSNKDQKTFDCVVKSGTFQASVTNNGAYNHSLYCGQNSASAVQNGRHYPGARYVTVEGGNLASMNGGRGTDSAVNDENVTYTPSAIAFFARIKGGTFRGSVFGGAADNSSGGSRKIVITGGEIRGWVAGGSNGTNSGNYKQGRTFGNGIIYVGGDAVIGGPNATTVNTTRGGQVFGAGRGTIATNTQYDSYMSGRWPQPASVINSYVVIADQAEISNPATGSISEVGGNVYGGGNYGTLIESSNVYILGGTVQRNVYGGAFGNYESIPTTNVYVKGGTVGGSVYGGSNQGGTVQSANVSVSGGTITGTFITPSGTGNVFGAGLGISTTQGDYTYYNITNTTHVNISGGTIVNNVFGGGEEGVVNGNTYVNVSGGAMIDVFGAGKGSSSSTAQVSGQTNVYVSGGTVTDVYGGGEAGDVVVGQNQTASFVTVDGGDVGGDVFGGGKMGKTSGNTQVDIESGFVHGDVFGGAYGEPGSVFVAGMHTVNMMGGRVFGSVYGGSRNANDGPAFTGNSDTETKTNAVVNISGGQVDLQVFAAGYYGKTYGSVYAFIGKNAILYAPHHMPSFGADNDEKYKATNLRLENNVWAGGDWGVFTSGSFGRPTVMGYSSIYVDGEGYDTESTNQSDPTYMNIAGNLFGCGTSCDAGVKGRMIMVRNYGYAKPSGRDDDFNEPYSEATRTLYSIQRADSLIIDNSNINFTGHARVNSLVATEKYGIYSFDKTVRIVNGSGLFLNTPVTQIIDFWNASCPDVYYQGLTYTEAVYTPIAYNGVAECPNKIRVNGGNYIEIYHDQMAYEDGTVAAGYGMLNGFAYMMVAQSTSDNTCAYARPKWCQDYPIASDLNNPDDGGWVSYDPDKNIYDIAGNHIAAGNSDQMPYENHVNRSRAGEQHFRIWRTSGLYSEREVVINVEADGSNTFDYREVSIKLPAWRSSSSFYAFQTVGEGANLNTTVDYGTEVMMYNSALIDNNGNWIHFNEQTREQEFGPYAPAQNLIISNPNVNFGMLAMPGLGMSIESPQVGDQAVPGVIVCNESDAFLASVTPTSPNVPNYQNKFNCDDFEVNPQLNLRLTFHNSINTNMSWEPMFITLVQWDNGVIKDIVRIVIKINTFTTLDREFVTQAYAVMNGTGAPSETYITKLVLPTFDIYDVTADHLSYFKLQSVEFTKVDPEADDDSWVSRAEGGYDIDHFAMEIAPGLNMDNSNGWEQTINEMVDSKNPIEQGGTFLGETGGRDPFAFDFRLTYNGNVLFDGPEPMIGYLTFHITYDNVRVATVDGIGNPVLDPDGNPTYHAETKNLTIIVQVIRRGIGNVFYLDGINGSNGNDALHPDKASLTLSNIFNRCGYLPGDIIYIVNAVEVPRMLEWSGTRYNGVTIYRYPGGHPLSKTHATNEAGEPLYYIDPNDPEAGTTTEDTGYPVWVYGEIVDNPDNEEYTGALINVENNGELIIRDITLDGHNDDHNCPVPTQPGTDSAVESEAPLINVEAGGTLILTMGTTLKENTNTNSDDGSAVVVESGGTLMMNENATIKNNVAGEDGGAVYVEGNMIVSGSVQVASNHNDNDELSNVYLSANDDPEAGSVVQIGTHDPDDNFGPITSDAHIGITKELTGDIDDWPEGYPDPYTQILYVENEEDIAWLDIPFNSHPNAIVFHDGGLYQLERFDDPQYLYWIETWVTVQYHVPTADEGGWSESGNTININTKYQLAWLISLVNGENGQIASTFEGKTINVNMDLNMVEHTWVPIGTNEHPFLGTFEGNGHCIDNIRSILLRDDAGMFGVANNADIKDMVVFAHLNGNSVNKGTIIGTMDGGKLTNVEAAGYLIGRDNSNTENMGGLVGVVKPNTNALIHSCFAANDITVPTATTVVGGLIGDNGGDLYNSYANVVLADVEGVEVTTKGGLVGINKANCTVENCYVINPIGAAFADQNSGTITICYAANGTIDFVESGLDPTSHGTYGPVKGRKEIGYMYYDNVTQKVEGEENDYIKSEIAYANGHISTWPGLLSTLNQWVVDNPKELNPVPTTWFRSTSSDLDANNNVVQAYINGDLPVLGFPKDNTMGTLDSDGRYLRYGSNVNFNGVDLLLAFYNDDNEGDAEPAASIFHYGKATGVTEVPTSKVKAFINEDAVLLQAANAGDFINTTVGVTFDNSDRNSPDYFGNTLEYDWHLMATPLSDADMGITYNENIEHNWWDEEDEGQVIGVSNSYMPDNINEQDEIKWDFYCYYEPMYHWINFKRNSKSHHHFDAPHAFIDYTNEEKMMKAKGYMMAISQDSYLNNKGTLNKGDITITLTCSGELPENEAPTKDWGSNLIGNPYQAYLDLVKVSKGDGQMEGTGYKHFYIYDAETDIYTPFVVDQSQNSVTPSRYIHPHQGFFVLKDDLTPSEPFTIKYGMATTDTDSQGGSYFRGEEQVNYPLVNIFAENAQGNRDLTIIEFNRPELGGAQKINRLRNANFMISAYFEGRNYGMLFTPENTEKVPVHFKVSEDGTYTLRWNTENGNFTSLRLVDNITGINYDMLANDSYTFEAHVSDYSTRFYITYACTGIDEDDNVDNYNSNFAFFDGSEWVINGKGQLDVVDVLGRVVYSERLYNDQNRVDLNNVAKGVYLLRIADNKNVMVQKIVVK